MKLLLCLVLCMIFVSPLFALDDPIYHINDKTLNQYFLLNDFYVYPGTVYNEVYARLSNTSDQYFEFVRLTFNFFNKGNFVGTEFTYISYETYGTAGMLPHTMSFLYDYVDIFDFDSVSFQINYDLEDGLGISFCKDALVLVDTTITHSWDLTYKVSGIVKSEADNDISFPTIFMCAFKDDHMLCMEFTYLDVNDNIIHPGQETTFYDYFDLPAEYDEIRYYPNYDLSSTGNVTVPVELSNFNAIAQSDRIRLIWETNSESNNYGFEIERSFSGENAWINIGFVKGNGTSFINHNYFFEDSHVENGKWHYRLKQIDLNGQYKYSNSVTINFSNTIKDYFLAQNFPNPFNEATVIQYSIPHETNINIDIFSITGQKILNLVSSHQSAGVYKMTWNPGDLPSGVYFCKFEAGEFVQVIKLVYQK